MTAGSDKMFILNRHGGHDSQLNVLAEGPVMASSSRMALLKADCDEWDTASTASLGLTSRGSRTARFSVRDAPAADPGVSAGMGAAGKITHVLANSMARTGASCIAVAGWSVISTYRKPGCLLP